MAMAALRLGARRLAAARPRPPPPPPATHSRAAVAEEPRRLLWPLPRHIYGGSSSPAGPSRTFSLAEEQRRRLLPMRLFHGGPTAAARIYSHQFCSSKHGEPNPITFKNIMGLFIETFGLLLGISTILMKVALFGMAIALLIRDLSGPRYVPVMAKIMFGPVDDIEKHRPRALKDGKWVETEPQRR